MSSTTQPIRRLVVTGATGKQGGALVSALLAKPSQPFEIYAVTRDKASKSAQSLASKPNVYVIEGDFSDPSKIFQQVREPWGLFSVTMPSDHKKEEIQGKALTQAAIEAGVKHIVFTATDRGGPIVSETEPTLVPHFASKFNIEKDIVEKSKQSGGTWTFLRPVAFMDNMTSDFLGRAFNSMWRLNGQNGRLQLIDTKDIGRIAAEAFLAADTEKYRNKAMSLAGDDLTFAEASRIFKEVTGQELGQTSLFVARALKWMLHQQLGIMFNWFQSSGFGADIPALRKEYPQLKDFRTWLETESAWREQKQRQ